MTITATKTGPVVGSKCFSNTLVDAILRTPLTARELKIMLALERFAQESPDLRPSARRLAGMTRMARTKASRIVKALTARNIIVGCTIQTESERWLPPTRSTMRNGGQSGPRARSKPDPGSTTNAPGPVMPSWERTVPITAGRPVQTVTAPTTRAPAVPAEIESEVVLRPEWGHARA